jgi:ATP/maltotriose-dependent transcriptional regulator MalT
MSKWITQGLALAHASGDRRLQVDAHAWAAIFELTHDEVPKATRRIQHVESLLARPLDEPMVDIQVHFVLGLHAYAVGHSAQAAAIFQDLLEQAHGVGLYAWDVPLYMWYGFARLAQGDIEGAVRARDRLEHHPGIQGAYGAHYYHQLCAADALERGDAEQARRHAQGMLTAAERAGSPFMQAWARCTLAGVEVMIGSDHAMERLDAALDVNRRLGSRWPEAGVLMVRALYACQFDSSENARRALTRGHGLNARADPAQDGLCPRAGAPVRGTGPRVRDGR